MMLVLIKLAIYLFSIFVFFKVLSLYYEYRSTIVTVASHNIGGGGIGTFLGELKWKLLRFWEKFRVFVLFILIAYIIFVAFGDYWTRIISFAFSVYTFVINRDAFDLLSSYGYEKNKDKLAIVERYLWTHYKDGCFENYDMDLRKRVNGFDIYIKIGKYDVATEEAKHNLEKYVREACGIVGLNLKSVIVNIH